MSHPQRFFEFDNFLLDSQQRLLFRDGEPLDLTPKVFDVLLELVQSGGRVVEKKELMEKIWPDSFVEESNLTQQVSTLRKKLGQDAAQQRYILTVPGRGYRFVAPLRSWDDDAVVTVQERIRSRVTITGADEGLTAPAADSIQVTQRLLQATTRRSSTKRVGLLLLLAIVLGTPVLFVVFKLLRGPSTPTFAKVKLTRFTTDGTVDVAAISPNGKHVAYVLGGRGQFSLWIRQVATSNPGVMIIGPGNLGFVGLTFSPDNDYIYYSGGVINSPTALYRVPALGGKPERLIEDVDTPPTFSPDGKKMAYLRGYPDKSETALFIAGSDGRAETKLTSLKAPTGQLNLGPGPSWSPDGERIACSVTVTDEAGQHQEIYVAGVSTGEFKPLTNGKWLRVLRVGWTNDGKGLLTTASDPDSAISQVWHIDYPSGETRRVTNDLSDYRTLTVSADSQVIAVVQSDQRTNVWVSASTDGTNSQQVTNTNYDGFAGLCWAPDGRLIYSAMRNGSQDLWITDAAGKEKSQLTHDAGQNSWPAISPDGRTIVFMSSRDGKEHLWKMDADGSHAQLLTDGLRDNWPSFTPDGQWVIYRSAVFGPAHIYKVSINGGPSVPLTEKGLSGSPALSPDGKTVAFTFRQPALGPVRIALTPVDGSGTLTIVDSKEAPRRALLQWTSDGKAIAFIKTIAGVSNIWLQPLNGPSRQLTNFDSQSIFNFALARDGRLAVTRGYENSDVVLITAVN